MITIHETLTTFQSLDFFCDCQPQTALFFDIETTGLSHATSMVFLIGAVRLTPDGWQLSQHLAEHTDEEKELISVFLTLASGYQTLIHFNGTTFDIPYLSHKAETYGLHNPFPDMYSIDLYQKFRPLKKLLSLERMNQTALEKYLQYHRKDRLTGKHMISLFQKYTASKETGIRDLLLLHNHDDLVGMIQLLRMHAYLMLPEEIADVSQFHIIDEERKDAHRDTKKNLQPSDRYTSQEKAFCELTFLLNVELPVPFECSVDDVFRVNITGKQGHLHLPVLHDELRYFFPDCKNYYYLPLEDQAVHKSVGVYVDKAHRTTAKPHNCYIRKTGTFLPQPDVIFEPVFRKAYDDIQSYFTFDTTVSLPQNKLQQYVKLILQKLLSRH